MVVDDDQGRAGGGHVYQCSATIVESTLVVAAPAADVQSDVLFTTDGSVLTSAGVVGGVDLCLHLVRRELGADIAAKLARRLVMPPAREGGQRQYTEPPPTARPSLSAVSATISWAATKAVNPIGSRKWPHTRG
jgi:transcriptional regulator GlxA family with amidase domain